MRERFYAYSLTLAVLAYASYSDLRTREVSDVVWIVGCPVGLALSLFSLSAGSLQAISLALSSAVSACAGFALYKLGLIGGADALALLFIGLTVPAYPEGLPLYADPLGLPFFAVLCNAALLSLTCPVTIFFLNFMDLIRGLMPFRGVEVKNVGDLLILLLTARRISLERLLKGLYYFPAETIEDCGGRPVRVPVYFTRAEANLSEVTAKMVENRQLYSDGVLASPTIPMIVFLTLGLALLPVGNLVFTAIHLLRG
ncbi:MAG: prepilin peptidase [Candidatus Brockarchaeota archaeon]|nr:prepilin peptidase [Candidatus Brockarchaeota archaeon]